MKTLMKTKPRKPTKGIQGTSVRGEHDDVTKKPIVELAAGSGAAWYSPDEARRLARWLEYVAAQVEQERRDQVKNMAIAPKSLSPQK